MLVKRAKRIALSTPPLWQVVHSFDERRRETWRSQIVFEALASRSTWLFSQMKSGSTLACNLIAFYRSIQRDIALDFDSIANAGVIRLTGRNGIQSLEQGLASIARLGNAMIALQSHLLPSGVSSASTLPDQVVIQTRDPFDYCVSAYHYNIRNRVTTQHVDMDKGLKRVAHDFARIHHVQTKVLSLRPNALIFRYEDLVKNPSAGLTSLLKMTGDKIDEDVIDRATEMVTPDKITQFERTKGRAIVAGADYIAPHFIKSGSIGEGESLSHRQRSIIEKVLAKNSINCPHNW